MGGTSGGGGNTSSSTVNRLPKWATPTAQEFLGAAANQYFPGGQIAPSPLPNQQVAPFTQEQLQAMQLGGAGVQFGLGGLPYAQQSAQTAEGAAPLVGQQQQQTESGLPYTQEAGQLTQQGIPYAQQSGQLTEAGLPYAYGSAGLAGMQTGDTQAALQAAQAANANIASGANLDPSTNKYLQSYYNAAAQPVIQNFQQAIAPNILGNAVAAGGLGSSGTQQAFSNAESNLGQQLGNLSANIYEPAYQQGLAQQASAIGQAPGLAAGQYIPSQELGQAAQTLYGGANQLGNTANTLYGGGNALNQAAQGIFGGANALGNAQQGVYGLQGALGNAANTIYGGANQIYGGAGELGGIGQQQQQQAQNVLQTGYQNALSQGMWPYTALQMFGPTIGQAIGNAGSQITTSTNPSQTGK